MYRAGGDNSLGSKPGDVLSPEQESTSAAELADRT